MRLFHVTIFFAVLFVRAQSDITVIGELPNTIWETSGLINYNGRLITHNDSGNAAELYVLDPITLQITRTIQISNVENRDWEDLAQDSDFIYIGDFGNNSGDRRDLRILRISKEQFDSSSQVTAEEISFVYEDQEDFTTVEESDFDAEAFFVFEDALIVLTKQWRQLGTTAYRIPKIPGAFLAERLDSYQVDGLVTGATFNENGNELYLVGYSKLLSPFFVKIDGVENNQIFGGFQEKSDLEIGFAQVEGITSDENGLFYISSESFSNALVNSESRLFGFTLDVEEEEEEGQEGDDFMEEPISEENLVVFKSIGTNLLFYQLTTERFFSGMGIFDSSGKMVSFTPLEFITEAPIDLTHLSQGLYYLVFFDQDRPVVAPFFKD